MAPVILERMYDFASWLAQGKVALPSVLAIPPSQCLPTGSVGEDIIKDRDYITVSINELFLSNGRKAWAVFDPMVLVTTSFIYGTKRISVPAVVGPGLLAQEGQRLPQGIVLHDTTVAGPYAYRGGPVTISLAFYRVRNQDYAQSLLRMVESVAAAVGPAAEITVLARVGNALIEGVNRLVGMGETEPIAGHRLELSPMKSGGFRTAFSALIGADEQPAVQRLRVAGGRLRVIGSSGELNRYEAADYVLYSVTASDRRDDENTLPIFALYRRALENAARGGEDAWAAAKATFVEVWQQLLLSPDVTKAQAEELYVRWKNELLVARERGENTRNMSRGDPSSHAEIVRGAAAILAL
jgi:hypothetical protein